ncbi:MAG: GGDEF domain-containing protein [Burkholderiaceae bacterium]|nr:GGDEF domain-containing protein [Burkholderiaceae bacterium]
MAILLILVIIGALAMAAYIGFLKQRVSGYVFNERNMADALNHVDAAIYMKDSGGRYIYANNALLRLRGKEVHQLYGNGDRERLPQDAAERSSKSDARVFEAGESTREEVTVGDGESMAVYLESKYPLIDRRGKIVGLVGILTEVTELFRLRRELELMARTDELTGVQNRRAFFEFADAAMAGARRHGRPMSMLIVDIDHFKQINDRFGHPVGDRVLKEVAAKMTSEIRNVDCAARIGGEEFAVLLNETDLLAAVEVADRIRLSLQPIALQNNAFVLPTVSIGVATLHAEDQSVHNLYQRADAALYKAKAIGRNRVYSEDWG